MTAARVAARDAAQRASEAALLNACTFAALHGTTKPLFQRMLNRRGSPPVLVRFVWPGVLLVCDPKTGQVLAQSEPGRPSQIAVDFEPPLSLEPVSR